MSAPNHILHQMWLSDGPTMPPLYKDWCEQYQEMHGHWEYRFWSEPPPLENQTLFDRAAEIAPHAPQQFAADVARYEILHRFGGVWMDADVIPHKPLDDLMGGPWVVRHSGKWIANGILGFPQGHDVLSKAIAGLAGSVRRAQPHWGNTRRSGPQYFTPIVRPFIRSGEVRALPEASFLPYDWDQLERHGQAWGEYGTHVFGNQRRKRNMPIPS